MINIGGQLLLRKSDITSVRMKTTEVLKERRNFPFNWVYEDKPSIVVLARGQYSIPYEDEDKRDEEFARIEGLLIEEN